MGLFRRGHRRISPTAHYTGMTWVRAGLAPTGFGTWQGRLMHATVRPFERLSLLGGGASLEQLLLARHRVIDDRLATAIRGGRIGQVVEIAAGLSPRGQRFADRFPHIRYVEGDLPDMARRKRQLLQELGLVRPNHRVVELDALRDDGPGSLPEVTGTLSGGVGTAVITEGLLAYFDRATVEGMWRRFAGFLHRFPQGLYLADLNIEDEAMSLPGVPAFRRLLSLFAGGQVHLHYPTPQAAEAAVVHAGFARARVPLASSHPRLRLPTAMVCGFVRVLEAVTPAC